MFASAEGVVNVFANLGVNGESGEFLGLEHPHQRSVRSYKYQVHDAELQTPLDLLGKKLEEFLVRSPSLRESATCDEKYTAPRPGAC